MQTPWTPPEASGVSGSGLAAALTIFSTKQHQGGLLPFPPVMLGGSEDRNLVSADHIKVVIQSQQHQEREKQGSSREEVPDVMVIKEIQQDTLSVLLPGFSWSSLPAAEVLEEKVQGRSPHHGSGHDAEDW